MATAKKAAKKVVAKKAVKKVVAKKAVKKVAAKSPTAPRTTERKVIRKEVEERRVGSTGAERVGSSKAEYVGSTKNRVYL